QGGVAMGAPAAVSGPGSAARFDGVDDFIQVPDAPALRLSGSFSIELWAKPDGAPTTMTPGLANKAWPNGWTFYYYPWTSANLLRPSFRWMSIEKAVTSAGVLSSTSYRHYVVTYDAPSATLTWYVDGALDNVSTGVTYAPITSTAPFEI